MTQSVVVDFNNLPEGCIANILSFTSPRDVCRLSLLSSTFRSAAQSDAVWNKFLPSDFHTILSQSSSLSLPSKKDLFLYLCQKPLLIDDGKMVPKQIFLLSLFKKGALKRLFVVKRLILQYFVNVGNGMMMLSFQLDKVVALDFASRCQVINHFNHYNTAIKFCNFLTT